MYSENNKTLMKFRNADRNTHCANGLEDMKLLKFPYYPRQYTDIMQPYQNTNGVFHRTRNILKFVWKHKRTQIAKTILRRQKLKVSNFLISNCPTKLQ